MLDFLRAYNRPQNYKAEIRVEVRNMAKNKGKATLVIPMPRSTEYQKIYPVFKESILTFDLKLRGGENKIISLPFKARVLPRRYTGKINPEIIHANDFVIGYLTYGNPIDGLYSADEAREKRIVDCGGFDALMQDELKKSGIHSDIIAGFWNSGKMHAWLEIDGKIPADPSVEYLKKYGKTKKSGRLGFVGSDRITFSIGEPFLQHPYLVVEPLSTIIYEKHFYCARA